MTDRSTMNRLRPTTVACALIFPLLLALPGAAQEAPRVELFGGYSFLHAEEAGRNGWNASARFNLSRWLGIEADASVHYAKVDGDPTRTTLAGGPTVSVHRSRGLSVYARVLGGVARERASIQVFDVEISEAETAFTLLAGGGVDLRLRDSLGLRLVQADWVYTRLAGEAQSGLRLSAGLVLRLGRR